MSYARSKNRHRAPKATASLPVIRPNAAGIDIGSTSIYVSVPIDSTPTSIAQFGAYTEDLLSIASWLRECHVVTVAMESTGVYWIPLYEILEEQGFEVFLVAPTYPKKPAKSDIEDCQWLQYLHSVGLLKASFRPPNVVCAIRSVLRCRATLVAESSQDILRMQKAMIQMNLLLHNVISDISGITGLAIVDAILAGETDPRILAQFRDGRIKATVEQVEKSLRGHYRQEHIFALGLARRSLDFHHKQIAECDARIEHMIADIDADPPDEDQLSKHKHKATHNEIRLPHANMRQELARVNGVDLTAIPGVGVNVAAAIFTEAGSDLSKFPTADHFASWLKTTPQPRISGGRVLGHARQTSKPKLGVLLRQAVTSLRNSQTYLGDFYRRMKSRLGPRGANHATAHKVATIIWVMITTKQPYDETKFQVAKERLEQKKRARLIRDAASLGIQIIPT